MNRYCLIAQDKSYETSVDIATCENKEVAVRIAQLLNENGGLQDDSAFAMFAAGGPIPMTVRVYDSEDNMEEVGVK